MDSVTLSVASYLSNGTSNSVVFSPSKTKESARINSICPAANITACDHLEESMFPVETLGKTYVVALGAAARW